jgi:SAM-dependent methyltransferase
MGHIAILHRALSRIFPDQAPARLVELGSGDGTFLPRLARALSPKWPAVHVVLVDRRPCVSDQTRAEFAALGWTAEIVEADVFQWLPRHPGADVMLANLFLHHFEPQALRQLLCLAAQNCRHFVACEPRRNLSGWCLSRLLWAIGCHPVTRHDAVVSVRAGFRNREISARWSAPDWTLHEEPAGLLSHLFVASKTPPR